MRRALPGGIGVLIASALWLASVLALAYAMGHTAQASSPLRAYSPHTAHARTNTSDLPMILGCTAFTLLQLASFLLFAFVFRAAWRLRTAVCFSLATGLVIVADTAALFALLVWLGISLGAG